MALLCLVYAFFRRMDVVSMVSPAEGIMATAILLILCVPAEGFLLYCMFHFALEMRRPRRRPNADLLAQSPSTRVVPLQFLGSYSIAVWSDGTWHRFVSTEKNPVTSQQDSDLSKKHQVAARDWEFLSLE
jgi:hypothetical protein